MSYTRFLSPRFTAVSPLAIKLRLRYCLTCVLFEVLLRHVSAEKCDVCNLFLCISYGTSEPFEKHCIAVSVVLFF